MTGKFNVIKSLDKLSVFYFFILMVFGWLNVYGASVTDAQTSAFDPHFRSGMQLIWIGVSLLVAGVILLSNCRFYNTLATVFYALIILVLIATVFLGKDVKGSHSWLQVGPISVQPAEFSKFITALMLAHVMGKEDFVLKSFKSYMQVIGIVLLPMLLIIAQKETGSALVFFAFVLMFYREGLPGLIPILGLLMIGLFVLVLRFSDVYLFGGEQMALGIFIGIVIVLIVALVFLRRYTKERKLFWWLFGGLSVYFPLTYAARLFFVFNFFYITLLAIFFVIGVFLYFALLRHKKVFMLIALFIIVGIVYNYSVQYLFQDVLEPHQQTRIKVVLGMANDPTGISYNVNQARIAIGSGGIFGKGYLQGTQTKLKYVPEQDTDFIFSTIGEDFGFVGSVSVLLIYLLFLFRLITIAERQTDRFVRIYGYSVISIFAMHLFVNVGMVLGLVPVIGIPLPFFSYGGSSFLSFTILLFIFLRLDTFRIEKMT